jgi:hypothetical protein
MVLGAIVLGAILVLVGGIALALGVNDYRDGEATSSWPSTTARVLASEIHEDTDRVRNSNGRSRTRTTYKPEVRYEYTVDGTIYHGNRIRIGDYSGGEDRANETVNRYPAGSEVTVYHDLGDSGSAVLEQGADRTGVYFFGGIGAGFSVIGPAALTFGGVFLRRVTRGSI